MAKQDIEFFFDFASPYGYIAAHLVQGLAAKHGRAVKWQPFMLGAVFKVAGTQPLVNYPLKGDYSRHDIARTARLYQVPLRMPDVFPIGTVSAARIFYWLAEQQPEAAVPWAKAAYKAYFADNRDISQTPVVAALLAEQGLDVATALAGAESAAIKAHLRTVTEGAVARGVFGSPYFFVDGEPFWGNDRLDMMDRWLATGGW
jgi:2-hydroxychromene-2-carboxylate isomerase